MRWNCHSLTRRKGEIKLSIDMAATPQPTEHIKNHLQSVFEKLSGGSAPGFRWLTLLKRGLEPASEGFLISQ
jgi:hypothetical protein